MATGTAAAWGTEVADVCVSPGVDDLPAVAMLPARILAYCGRSHSQLRCNLIRATDFAPVQRRKSPGR